MWRPSRDDREPFVLPDGRTIRIKFTFVRTTSTVAAGQYGLFRPRQGTVLWADDTTDDCWAFGLGQETLDKRRERSAILPVGPEREKAYKEYIEARKFILNEMIGRVVSVAGGGETQDHVWVLGVEETLTIDFEIMLDKARNSKRKLSDLWSRKRSFG